MFLFPLLGFLALGAWIYLAVWHGQFWQPLLPEKAEMPKAWPSVDIVVPARNEADMLPLTLPWLLKQNYQGDWRIILVDDHSKDGTAAVARKIAERQDKADKLTVISAPELPKGWTGKLAAMNAGLGQSRADMVLFTDADIRHRPQSLSELVASAEAGKLDLASRMVKLNCTAFAEKLLIPAFVFFFAMLYPFRRANNMYDQTAAAAGGVMLLRRKTLDKIGGLERIKGALIDDCSLAKLIKSEAGNVELTLTQDIDSLRAYPRINDVWRMVARTAYTQLGYSPLLLAGTVLGMALLFLLPPLLFLYAPTLWSLIAGFGAYLIMTLVYLPTIRFYDLPWAWALALPAAALVYVAATVDSARLYHKGKGGQWKGRAQA